MSTTLQTVRSALVADQLDGRSHDDGAAALRRLAAAVTGRTNSIGAIAIDHVPSPRRRPDHRVPVTGGADAEYVILVSADPVVRSYDTTDSGLTLDAFEDIGSGSSAFATFSGTGDLVDIDRDQLLAAVRLIQAATITGVAREALALTRAHVRTREQFGASLVTIPAVASNVARMRVADVQATAAITRAASTSGDEGPTGTAEAIAWLTATRCATEIARIAHQLHGAIGIRDGHPLTSLSRRIWAIRDSLGPETPSMTALGRWIRDRGESALWEQITRPA